MLPLPASTASAPATAAPPGGAIDFGRQPFLVIWEVTRACALACVHCRADAIARRDPRELTTDEGFGLMDEVRAFGNPAPLLVLTGGDPMWRKDLAPLVAYGRGLGLSVALTPSGTAMPTRQRLQALKDAGLSRIAVSLDGPDAATHDAFRRVRGSFDYTRRLIDLIVDLGLPLQINSTVSRITRPHLPQVANLVATWPVSLWAVFFLVQMGRGSALESIAADECEDVLQWLTRLSRTAPFGIKTTEAPHFRRVQAQVPPPDGQAVAVKRAFLKAPRAVTDGNGFVFVDHVGDICPSGFLPLTCGNVRRASLVDVYRNDPRFVALRTPDVLGGRCGRCEFRALCGGSRSRAFAATGDPMAEDPLCAYDPGPDVRDALPC
jgi:AdoMet-dependent heme synthase